MIIFSSEEQAIIEQYKRLKAAAGTHSPSISSLTETVKGITVKTDACFLSNPYATDLFLEYFQRDLIINKRIRDVLEFYPTQNRGIACHLEGLLGVPANNIFIGNGAIEIIQALLHRFTKKRMLVILPTFSPYYEFARSDVEVFYHTLDKENFFILNTEKLLHDIVENKIDTLIIVNPNNPDGSYIPLATLYNVLKECGALEQVIIDESFIHFAYEEDSFAIPTCVPFCAQFSNLVVVKSMSKDFGIAGVRAGYAVMNENKVSALLQNGYLWNSNGIAEYFFKLMGRKEFLTEYEQLRCRYIKERQFFYEELSQISQILVYPTSANFFLVELLDGTKANDLALALLLRHGIYIRSAKDKKGLSGEFVRVASRRLDENKLIAHALKDSFV